jgi:DNA helicase-2/ATP-dependent DNA helicase PcrA
MSDASPLCLVAAAGSGKTTVLTRRVARRVLDGSVDAQHAVVLTFTRKASAELRGRLSRLDVPGQIWAGTFHAAAYAQLRRHWADNDIRPPTVLDDPARLMRRVLRAHGQDASDAAGAIVTEVQWAQARMVAPPAYVEATRMARRRTPIPAADIAEAYARYVEAKHTHRLIDLNDLLVDCADLLEHHAATTAVARWRIRHLFVDEFQDVNPAQWRLLTAWLQDRSDLFVVGDPRQAVYGWNGADPSLLDRLPELLPGTTVLRLDTNHRSSPQVIAAARSVLDDGDGAGPALAARTGSTVHEEPLPVGDDDGVRRRPDGPPPSVRGFDDDADEATAVARWLRLMHRPGRPWSHLAVLARTNARLEPVAAALRGAGIPFRLGSGGRADGDLARAVEALRRAHSGRPLRSTLADLSIPEDTEAGRRAGCPVPPALRRLADEHALAAPGATVGEFLAWVAATVGDIAGADTENGRDSVELATFHKAKGLEWPCVAVVGLEDGLVPIAYATSPGARSEEQRLLYVALTRAGEDLWCSWAQRRQHAGRSWSCRPSPMLPAITAAGSDDAPHRDAVVLAGRISSLRARLPAAG